MRYTRTAIALHWFSALLIVCGFALGLIMVDLAISPLKLRMFSWHKWIGVTVLAISLLRLGWRLGHRPPPPVPMPHWQSIVARLTHALLYLLLLAAPLSGWMYSSASGYPVVFLGLLPLPNLVTKDHALAEVLKSLHHLLVWSLCLLVLLHFAAAIKHHVLDRDETLRRMLPWFKE